MVKRLPPPSKNQDSPIASTASAERSYPLVALLQLATCWAALAACVDGAELRSLLARLDDNLAVGAAIIGGAILLGGMLGLVMGLGQLRAGRSAAAGFLTGGVCGLAILAAYAAPTPPARGMAAAGMVLLTTIAFRCRAP